MKAAQVLVLLVVLAAGSAAAQEEFGAWLTPRLGQQKTTLSYEGAAWGSRPVSDQDASLGLERHEVRAAVPLAQDERTEWVLQARAGAERLRTDARLPESGDALPKELWDLRLGATHRRLLAGGWIAGFHAAVGSPSDAPFSGWDQTAVTATAFVRVPSGERNAWLLSLNYSNVRGFLDGWPLPGVGYAWSPSDRLRAVLGLPFAFLDARPADAWQFQLSAFPTNVRARTTWRFFGPLRAYGAFVWGGREYLRQERDDEGDRLQLYETAAEGGLRFDATRQVTVDLFGGYAWNRFLFEGRRLSDRHDDRIDVGDGPYGGLRAGARF